MKRKYPGYSLYGAGFARFIRLNKLFSNWDAQGKTFRQRTKLFKKYIKSQKIKIKPASPFSLITWKEKEIFPPEGMTGYSVLLD